MDLGRNTYMRQRKRHQGPLMLVDSEPQDKYHHSPNWVMVSKAKQKGGSETGKYPHVRRNDDVCLPS